MIAILKKELRAALREKLGWAILLAIPGLIALFSFFTLDGSAAYASDRAACEIGRRLLSIGVNTYLFVAMLLVPLLSAVNLVREDEKKTLEVLLASPRSGFELGLAKLLSPVIVMMLSAALALPFLMALSLLGGVRPWEPVLGLVAAFFTALAASAGGMAAGALTGSTAGAVLVAGLCAFVVATSTSWPLWSPGSGLFGASLPMGMARCIVSCEELAVGAFSVPMLLPGAIFLSLVCGCLFFAALPPLTTVFRRRALPVRLLAAAAATFLIAMGALTLRDEPAREVRDVSSFLLIVACAAPLALLSLERFDSAGFLRTLPGTAESEDNRAGGLARRFLASRLGLAFIPLLATVPGVALMYGRVSPPTPQILNDCGNISAGYLYVAAWVLFCVASSGLLADSGRRWRESIFCQFLPLLVFATFTLSGIRCDPTFVSGPVQLLSQIGVEASAQTGSPQWLLVGNAILMAFAAGAVAAVGRMRRRGSV